jgi:eukaryotic-like serine/threonine-protein kinase
MAEEQTLVAGRYLLREPVGTGGMGRVWLARDELLRRDVAIKEVVPPQWLTEDERIHLRELTLREAQAAARLNHPHVVKIYDVVQSELWPWIVMEYVPSRSLQSVLEQEGPLPPERVAAVGLAVLDALRAAHKVGVLHRDVKPHNVLIGDDGRVVLTDFGLATLDTDGAVTRPGLIATPQYLAPERARRGISTEASDMWSLGATMYAAVEGRTPYARPTVIETLTALATEAPDPVRNAGPLKVVIEGLLRREPGARLRPSEVERMLQRAVIGGDVPAQRGRRAIDTAAPSRPVIPVPASRRTWAWFGLAAVGAVAVIATTALATNLPDKTPGAATPSTIPSTFINRAPGVMNCENRPAAVTIVESGWPGPPDTDYPLVNGFTWFGTPGSWFIGVHEGWQTWRDGDVTCFSDPRGGRVLAVDPTRPPALNPTQAALAEEKRLRDAGLLPAYHLVKLQPRTISSPAAEWEFTFGPDDNRRHASAVLVQSRERTFVVYWATDEVDYVPSRPWYDVVLVSFRAGPPHGQGPPPRNDSPPPPPASPPPSPRY